MPSPCWHPFLGSPSPAENTPGAIPACSHLPQPLGQPRASTRCIAVTSRHCQQCGLPASTDQVVSRPFIFPHRRRAGSWPGAHAASSIKQVPDHSYASRPQEPPRLRPLATILYTTSLLQSQRIRRSHRLLQSSSRHLDESRRPDLTSFSTTRANFPPHCSTPSSRTESWRKEQG